MTITNEATKFVEGEVIEALRHQFGHDAVERANGPGQRFSVLFDATGCFIIEIVAVGGGTDLVNPEENRRQLERQHAA